MRNRCCLASLSLLGFASLALSAEAMTLPDVSADSLSGSQYDAAGRVVYDNENGRYVYSTPPPIETMHSPSSSLAPIQGWGPVQTPSGLQIDLEWYFAVAGTGIGQAGMVIGDIDASPGLELVASASVGTFSTNSYWYVLEATGTDYRHRWSSFQYGNPIDRLIVQQLDTDRALEILMMSGGHLLMYDGASFELELDLPIAFNDVQGLAAADLDEDGEPEVALCNDDGTWVLELATGNEQWGSSGLPCTDLAIGETDGTSGLEIVLGHPSEPGRVVDASSGNVEWSHPLGFGHYVALGDIDDDSMDEIAAGFSWSGIQVWNGDTHGFIFEVPISNLAALTFADVETDGAIELIYGDAQWGSIHVLDASGSEKWSVSNPEHGVTRIVVGDVDDDGSNEIYFGAGFTSTGPDHLYAVDSLTEEIEWQSDDLSGPFLGLSHGDIDFDGDPEVLFTSWESDSGYGDGLYLIFDARTHQREYTSPEPTGSNWTGLWKIGNADADNDAAEELYLPTSYTRTGALQCIDGVTHEVQWEEMLFSGLTFQSLRIADLDGDEEVEVVLGTKTQYSSSPGLYIFVYDAATGQLEWQSFDLQNFFGFSAGLDLLRLSDVDDDGNREILVASSGGGLLALDPVMATIDLGLDSVEVTALETLDLNSDGVDEVVVGTQTGSVLQVDLSTGQLTPLAPGPYGGSISGLAMSDLNWDGVDEVIFASNNRLYVVDGATQTTDWQSQPLGTGVGVSDSLTVSDFDGDGNAEIWVNAGWIGHLTFEVTAAQSQIFTDGFESGDLSVWSGFGP